MSILEEVVSLLDQGYVVVSDRGLSVAVGDRLRGEGYPVVFVDTSRLSDTLNNGQTSGR